MAGLPLAGRVLWPGAIVDEQTGAPVDWPGWELQNGVWVEGDEFDWLRDGVDVTFSVNPEKTVNLAYPPSSPDCVADPDQGVGGATSSPTITPPPTDTFDDAAGGGPSLSLVLLGLAATIAILALVTPAPRRAERNDPSGSD
jgi:hypothetical protein